MSQKRIIYTSTSLASLIYSTTIDLYSALGYATYVGIRKIRIQLGRSEEQRAKRKYQLTQPLSNYAGIFRNEMYGNVTVKVSGEHLAIKSGNLGALSSAFP